MNCKKNLFLNVHLTLGRYDRSHQNCLASGVLPDTGQVLGVWGYVCGGFPHDPG